MKISQFKYAFLTSALVISFFAVASAEAQKVGVVDLQRAINETEDGRKAKAQLKKLFKQKQDELDKRQTELKTQKDMLEKQKSVLARDVLSKKLEDYQKSFVDLQTKYVDYQKELASKEGELTKVIIARMENILRRIGQSESYSLIMERNEAGVVWVPTNLDLTDVVIQKYNAGEGKIEGAGAPAPAAAPAPAKKK